MSVFGDDVGWVEDVFFEVGVAIVVGVVFDVGLVVESGGHVGRRRCFFLFGDRKSGKVSTGGKFLAGVDGWEGSSGVLLRR